MTSALYTRHRTTGPAVEYISASIADPTSLGSSNVQITQSYVQIETVPGQKWTIESSFQVISYSNGWPTAGYWDVLIGHSYGETSTITNFTSNAGQHAQHKANFLSSLNELLKEQDFSGTSTVEMLSSYKDSEISDVPTHNFKKKFSDGQVINNPVYHRKTDFKVERSLHASLTRKYTGTVQYGYGQNDLKCLGALNPEYIEVLPPTDVEIENIRTEHLDISHVGFLDIKQTAINAAFGKVNKGAFAYLEELGEGAETVQYIASVFSRIGSMFKAVRRGHWKGVVPRTYKAAVKRAKARSKQNGTSYEKELGLAILDFSANAWMELRFAIRPLMFSVEDAIKLHQEGIGEHSGRSVQNYRLMGVGADSSTTEVEFSDYTTTTTTIVETHRTATAGVLINILASVAKMRTLGFTNIAGTFWELTFLSWAADYFANLDGLLYHLTPDIGVDVLTAWSGTLDEIKVSTIVVRRANTDNRVLDIVEYSTTNDVYLREPIDGPSLITLDVDLDVYKLADLGALFYGLLRSADTKGLIK